MENRPSLLQIWHAAIWHRFEGNDEITSQSCAMCQFLQLLGREVYWIAFHQTGVDMFNAKQVTHMETGLLLIFLLVCPRFFTPLHDVFNLGALDMILIKNVENSLIC